MRCRHTVPDWHRYVAAEEATRPVLAACRLLIREGEPAADARAIACGFWGRQRECPLYDGPESGLSRHPKPARDVATDTPAAAEHVWPVRQPGTPDGQRVLLMLLGGFSIVLLGWAVALSVAALLGRPVRSGYVTVTLIGGAVSLTTHVLVLLRLWIGR